MDRKEFGNKLTAERKRLNLRPNEMAELCGVKIATQYLYEKGDRVPNTEYLQLAFNHGVIASNLFTSLPNPSDKLYFQPIMSAYLQADADCRDNKGRLLDVEHRLSRFLELIKLPSSPDT